MEKLLSARDIAERYEISERTAMRYMRKMRHMEKPLRVTERAVEEWENAKTFEPGEIRAGKTSRRVACRRTEPGLYTISRKKPEIKGA